jgi:hypothetical protein
MSDKSKLMAKLLEHSKYALLDLKYALSELEVSGDRENPAWKTVDELDAIVKQLDPEWQSVVDLQDEDNS